MEPVPFDKRSGKIWYNGKLVDWKEANLHILSHGLHYASCVFEGERVYNGEIFKLREHTNRLIYSAERMGMKIPYSAEQIDKACKEIISVQNVKNEIKIKGIRLDISKWKKPPPDCIPWDTKASGLYMISTLSKHEAEKKKYHDALMMDYQGNIAEATGANIFFTKTNNNEIHTPIADSFLDGITRRSIIEIAKQLQIKVLERKIKLEELNKFDGCFLTGTAAEVTPVSQIGDINFAVVDMIKKLDDNYSKLVNKN